MLMRLLKEHGLRMSDAARQAFLEKVGTDTRLIVNELEKLIAYVGERTDVVPADIAAVTCAARGAISWDLPDAFGRKQLARALTILRRLAFQRESPIGLLIALESRIRDLTIYREGLDKGWLRVAGKDRFGKPQVKWDNVPPDIDAIFSQEFQKDPRATHPFRIGLLAAQASRFSLQELAVCRSAAVEAHTDLVSSGMSPWLVLELLLIRLLGGDAKPPQNRS